MDITKKVINYQNPKTSTKVYQNHQYKYKKQLDNIVYKINQLQQKLKEALEENQYLKNKIYQKQNIEKDTSISYYGNKDQQRQNQRKINKKDHFGYNKQTKEPMVDITNKNNTEINKTTLDISTKTVYDMNKKSNYDVNNNKTSYEINNKNVYQMSNKNVYQVNNNMLSEINSKLSQNQNQKISQINTKLSNMSQIKQNYKLRSFSVSNSAHHSNFNSKIQSKVKIPKLNLQILPNYHGKSNKSLNQSLLQNYQKKNKVNSYV